MQVYLMPDHSEKQIMTLTLKLVTRLKYDSMKRIVKPV
jgi:hypothetical protein